MSEKIKQVAKALEIAMDDMAGDDGYFFGEEGYEKLARIAIAAMQEPTPQMLKAACASMSPAKRPTPDRVHVKEKHRIRYGAMIDAALK